MYARERDKVESYLRQHDDWVSVNQMSYDTGVTVGSIGQYVKEMDNVEKKKEKYQLILYRWNENVQV